MRTDLASFPRKRVIWCQYFMTFSWSVGLGAAVPVIPLLSLQLNPNIALAGLVISIGGGGRFVVSYITGPLLDRFGRRGVGTIGVFIRMVFSFLEGLSPTYSALVFFRFCSGIGTSIWGTSQQTITADVATSEDRGTISGRRQGFQQLGSIIGPVIGGFAWWATDDIRVPFFINGFSKLLCLLVMLFVMVETRHLSQGPDRPQSVDSQSSTLASKHPTVGYSYLPAFLASMAATGFLYVLIGTFVMNMMRSTVQDLVLPVYVEEVLGLAGSQLGIIISAMGVGGLVTSFAAGRATDRWGVHVILVPGAILAAGGLGLVAQGPSLIPMILLAVALGSAESMVLIGTHAFAIDVSPPGSRGRFFGRTAAAGHFATLVGPFLVGGIADLFGLSAAFYAIALVFISMAPVGAVMGTVGKRVRAERALEDRPPRDA